MSGQRQPPTHEELAPAVRNRDPRVEEERRRRAQVEALQHWRRMLHSATRVAQFYERVGGRGSRAIARLLRLEANTASRILCAGARADGVRFRWTRASPARTGRRDGIVVGIPEEHWPRAVAFMRARRLPDVAAQLEQDLGVLLERSEPDTRANAHTTRRVVKIAARRLIEEAWDED